MSRYLLCIILVSLFGGLLANRYEVNRFKDSADRTIVEVTIPGIPEAERNPGPIATPSRTAVILSDVPKLDWSYGCTATSAAMISGYYDRNGYPDIYSGPTNAGVFPSNNASWGYGECPLSATHQGYDGLSGQGHVDRFWVGNNHSGDDPYGSLDPTGTYANCTADYLGTNQDYWNNVDGASTLFYYPDGTALEDYSGSETANPRKRDAIHGFRLFMESRGYSVQTNYNQTIQGYDGNSSGYTLAQFRQSIDNGIPVMIQVTGHSMVGVGYESSSNLIYIHDTWDHNLHSMTWGGSYSDMQHYCVSVIELSSAPQAANITWNPGSFTAILQENASSSQSLVIGNTGTGSLDYQCSIPNNNNTLQENFATSSIPAGWSEELVSGSALSWEYVSGGNYSNPYSAYEGEFNARLYKSNSNASVVKLISPVINLENTSSANLEFWHAQAQWQTDQDELRVYYRTSGAGAWVLLAAYTSDLSSWVQHNLSLPNRSATYQVAFEGTAQYGYGVCLDQISISAVSNDDPWLSFNGAFSVSGSIPAGAAGHNIAIDFDSGINAPGIYTSSITINSNSSANAQIVLPVQLEVLGVPDTPQNPQIVRLVTNSARLSWTAVSNVSGYKVYFSSNPDFTSATLIATVPSSRTYWVDTAANSRNEGFYRIVSYR